MIILLGLSIHRGTPLRSLLRGTSRALSNSSPKLDLLKQWGGGSHGGSDDSEGWDVEASRRAPGPSSFNLGLPWGCAAVS